MLTFSWPIKLCLLFSVSRSWKYHIFILSAYIPALKHSAWIRRSGVRVPLRSRHFLSKKFWHFHKNIRSCVENQCYFPRTVNISNVNITLKNLFILSAYIPTPLLFLSVLHVSLPQTGYKKPWTSYQIRKIAVCACTGNVGNVFPATDAKGNRQLAVPACITARASRTCRDACRDC